jgi:protein required for attachment to host cells
MENCTTWLLLADSSKAKIYSLHKARVFQQPDNVENLKLINEYSHNASRMKTRDLVADKLGEFGSGTFVEATTPKLHEAELFAHQLVAALQVGRNQYRDLIIVAPPMFMGILYKHMPHDIQKLITQKIEKDYTQQNGRELLQSLLIHL